MIILFTTEVYAVRISEFTRFHSLRVERLIASVIKKTVVRLWSRRIDNLGLNLYASTCLATLKFFADPELGSHCHFFHGSSNDVRSNHKLIPTSYRPRALEL